MKVASKNKIKKIGSCALLAVMTASFGIGGLTACNDGSTASTDGEQQQGISSIIEQIDAHKERYYDENVVMKRDDILNSNEEVTVIVKSTKKSLLDEYDDSKSMLSFTEYAATTRGKAISRSIAEHNGELMARLRNIGISYDIGNTYDVLLTGFEVTVKAGDLTALKNALGSDVTTIISEEYKAAESQLVTNKVNVYGTGIFDSSDSEYQGDGVVVAVLDTGLDYTHSAFSANTFSEETIAKTRLKKDSIASVIDKTRAYGSTSGLTADDVYMNARLPYGYDYADKDPDVYPIESEHGTHVSGVIVGDDDQITGVAPHAQLVTMKVFSDVSSGARTSWILAALEDCVTLGVDVINMSLGSSCGFTTEADKTEINKVYDSIMNSGISMVTAASNDYNSTYGSEKNGNLPLTTNPDSGTVGSPSTYEGSLSVASISGVKRPYLTYGNEIMYFTEASDAAAEPKKFVEDLLGENETSKDYTYVTIPGVGRSTDYTGFDVKGKIALVRRGTTTFEEKVRAAIRNNAAGIIIYNNVSGDISMNVGDVNLAVCSISRDNGEILAAQPNGTIHISRDQVAGPFMSDFSSWGPSGDLKIKPEITAHGGEIYSAVPGQSYDRMSGTSMASPNQAGVTALVRQYVKAKFPNLTNVQVAARVNQILMSTTDIAYNINGLPYAVRKQGSGLANLQKATSAEAYLTTFESGNEMYKTKLELGDDKNKTGEYTMTFAINNITNSAVTYDVGAIVMTEGVSANKTHQGDTTVTQQGYLLTPETMAVTGVNGDGRASGNLVTVDANKTATVTFKVKLSDQDKQYLNESFKYGMYVEGFVTLKATSGATVNLNVPFLAFYGDWTQAPIFDIDFYETNKDELDDSIDAPDKTMPDAYATRPIGGMEGDYISYLGSYDFKQDPSEVKIAADRKYIALSNQESAVNSLYGIYAGLLRNVKRAEITITDSTTGEVIYSLDDYDVRKSYSGGSTIYPASISFDGVDKITGQSEKEFYPLLYNLKNNTRYDVKITTYLDYGDGGINTNVKNVFEFPFVADFQAPSITGHRFYTEYDRSTKKTKLFVDLDVYDNHYAMAAQVGYVYQTNRGYSLDTFGRYPTAIYSEFNSTSKLTYELTNYIDDIKGSYNGKSIVVLLYDYAMNEAWFEVELPDDISDLYFPEDEITLSKWEVYDLNTRVYPETEWAQMLDYTSTNGNVARVVNNKIVAVNKGTAVITATSPADNKVKDTLTVTVLGEDDEGYVFKTKPVADSFYVTGYRADRAFYIITSSDRDIGLEGYTTDYGPNKSFSLKMYPSEQVTLLYDLIEYFPESTTVEFESGDDTIVTINKNGKVTAVAEGMSSVTVKVLMDGKPTYYSQTISVTVKDPYERSGPYLLSYRGAGDKDGVVVIPADKHYTEIQQYAFSGYEYVAKGPNDEISEEEPSYSKPTYIGRGVTIKKVVIPEGVKTIGAYAFAGLDFLEEVVIPTTCTKIAQGAFYKCTNLKKVTGLENVKLINQSAFYDCKLGYSEEIKLDNVIAIGNYAFASNMFLKKVTLPATAQSIGIGAFSGDALLSSVTINADSVKLGAGAFSGCPVYKMTINAPVIPENSFSGCSALSILKLGKDVSVIGQNAFYGTNISQFEVDDANPSMKAAANGKAIVSKDDNNPANDGKKLIAVAPRTSGEFTLGVVEEIGEYAFSGNTAITKVDMPAVKKVGTGAFRGCSSLTDYSFSEQLNEIGSYAFADTAITTIPSLVTVNIGSYAFSGTKITAVTVPESYVLSPYAFQNCYSLTSVTIGNDAIIGEGAFWSKNTTNSTSLLETVQIGDNVTVGNNAFYGAINLHELTMGEDVKIGSFAFFNTSSLATVNLSKVISIGDYAFSGSAGKTGSPFVSIDLSSCTEIGTGAFMNCKNLTEVTLNAQLENIPKSAFFNCTSLATVKNIDKVKAIGADAFVYAAFETVDLSACKTIGELAFGGNANLTKVTLCEGAKIYASAFRSCANLTTVENLGGASVVGAYAFAGTGLTVADLSACEEIGDFAFINSGVKSVKFGSGALKTIGENPFAGCNIPEFTKEVTEEFNNKNYTSVINTFDISDTVKVYDGVLYSVLPDGLQLVTYPRAKSGNDYVVKEGTIRIGARALAATAIKTVTLPVSLRSIGDQAFYLCGNLGVVTFLSADAPILEEAYDESYFTAIYKNNAGEYFSNAPTFEAGKELPDGTYVNTTGLGIYEYKIWNADPANYFFGANFVDYVGAVTTPLVMVRPSNGTHYDSFVYNQYFSTQIAGSAAPLQSTLDAIAAINALPSTVTLEDEAQVLAARELYGKVSLTEQQALVTNLEKLENLENTINFLKSGTTPEVPPEVPAAVAVSAVVIALSVVCGVLGLIVIAGVVVGVIFFKKKRN